MDYKDLIEDLNAISEMNSMSTRKRSVCKNAAAAITDLLVRAEEAEADRDRLREATKPNCLRCDSMHPDNGNCTEVGGFCTAVPAAHCPLIPRLRERAEVAERERDECRARYCSKEPCTTCAHYEENDCDGDCLRCTADCPCNKCKEYSMWEWNGRKEK